MVAQRFVEIQGLKNWSVEAGEQLRCNDEDFQRIIWITKAVEESFLGIAVSVVRLIFSLTWISLFGDLCNSRLLWPRKSAGLPCLRPTGDRSGLSVLGWALFCRSDPGQLGSHSRLRIAPFQATASQKIIIKKEMTDRLRVSKTLICLVAVWSLSEHA